MTYRLTIASEHLPQPHTAEASVIAEIVRATQTALTDLDHTERLDITIQGPHEPTYLSVAFGDNADRPDYVGAHVRELMYELQAHLHWIADGFAKSMPAS